MADYRHIELQTRLARLAVDLTALDDTDPEVGYLRGEVEELARIAGELVRDIQQDEFEACYLKTTNEGVTTV